MKKVLLTIILAQATAFAKTGTGDVGSVDILEKKAVLSCSGHHHGSYFDLYENNDGSLLFVTSNDADILTVWKDVVVTSNKGIVSGNQKIKKEILDAYDDSTEVGQAGVVIVTAKAGKSKLVLNFNTFSGENFISQNNYIEKLTCVVEK